MARAAEGAVCSGLGVTMAQAARRRGNFKGRNAKTVFIF